MKCKFLTGLLAATSMVAVDQVAIGQELRRSVAIGADARGGARVTSIGTGERVFTCGNSCHVWFISPVLQEIAWEVVTHHPLSGVVAETPANFTGEKTSWHGYDRFDFLMDDAALTVKPIKASPDEKDGINGQVKGQLRCVVVVPKEAAPGKPWSWRGRYFDHEPQAEIELLKRGFHIGFIQPIPASRGMPGITFSPKSMDFPKSRLLSV